MKSINKIFFLLLLIALFYSCDNTNDGLTENDGNFSSNPETGWIEFLTPSSNVELDSYDTEELLDIPIEINVPVSKTDLTITYTLNSISGLDPNSIFSNSGTLIVPENTSTVLANPEYPFITLDISKASEICETMEFDVVLTATDREGVSVGINGTEDTRPTIHRVTICPSINYVNDVNGCGAYLGDYELTIFGSNISALDSTSPIFTDNQIVTITQGPDGVFSRQFEVVYFPAYNTNTMIVHFSIENGTIQESPSTFYLPTNFGCTSEALMIFDYLADPLSETGCEYGESGDSFLPIPLVELFHLPSFGIIGDGGCNPDDTVVPFTVFLNKI